MKKLLFILMLFSVKGIAQDVQRSSNRTAVDDSLKVNKKLVAPADTAQKANGSFAVFNANPYYAWSGYWHSFGSSSGTVTGGVINWPGTIYTTPTTGTVSSGTLTFAPALSSQSAYTLLGRGSGSGTPSFLTSIDSNWIPTLHSEAYYNTKYLGGGASWPTGNYGNIPVTRNGVGVNPGSDSLIYTTAGGFVVKNTATFGTFSLSAPQITTGSITLQSLLLNNSLISDNNKWNGSFTRVVSGYASNIQMYNGMISFSGIGSGSGTYTPVPWLVGRYNNSGSVSIGGSPTTGGNLDGVLNVLGSSGYVGINTSPNNPVCRLQIAGFDAANYAFRTGSFIIQPVDTNNVIFGQNTYAAGSNISRIYPGYTSWVQWIKGTTFFSNADSAALGTYTYKYQFKQDKDYTGIGSDISAVKGNFTGALFKIDNISGRATFDATNTTTGTTGAQTINKPDGSVNFAAAATSLVVTNSLCTTSSHVICDIETKDANNPAITAVVPANGSFTIYLTTAPAAETKVSFWLRD
jgi:hypothetical protein